MCREICDLLVRSIAESCNKDHHNDPEILESWLANKTIENIRYWIQNNRTYCAKLRSGEIVGVLQVNSENKILLNYVDPNYTDKGIGTNLLRKLENEIGSGKEIFVESTETAKPFYLKKGFTQREIQTNNLSKIIPLV